jgi:hypothetical protein
MEPEMPVGDCATATAGSSSSSVGSSDTSFERILGEMVLWWE